MHIWKIFTICNFSLNSSHLCSIPTDTSCAFHLSGRRFANEVSSFDPQIAMTGERGLLERSPFADMSSYEENLSGLGP